MTKRVTGVHYLLTCPFLGGIISGMLQQGYAFGYLLATVFARGLVNTTPHGWREYHLKEGFHPR
jgi:hypothetical protein